MTYISQAGEQILQAIEQWGYLPPLLCMAILSHNIPCLCCNNRAIIIMFDCALPFYFIKWPENRKWRYCSGANTTETKMEMVSHATNDES